MRAAAAASFHLAPATKPAHRRGCTTESCSLKPAPTARPPRLRSLAGRAPLVCASLGISHDKGFDISDPNVVGQNDLLIVGPGVLGRIIAEKWKKEHPSCKVYGQTASKNHHNELTDLGIIPSLKGTTIHQKVPHVIFCAPPSGSDDYPRDVRKCVQIGSIKLDW
ncbi:NAD(P)-binding Rossmann-fold superfamily protein [Zea mays]|uniref:NAD(P)-binding Rossmann-fold superfamily protein n=1 Tax=Zea mays TaxID=4577 RepID=A0A1D6MT60_MAIZE|nr:NAD(P)-binding Rossmann-fold superfamily protein [Zea mays]